MTRLPGSSPLAIMTLRDVREAGAAGAGLVAFNPALDAVLWANLPGRAVFGMPEGTVGLPVGSVAARQIKASARLLDTWGEARILVRSPIGRSSKAVVATLKRIDAAGVVLLTLPELRPAAVSEIDWAEVLLAESGLDAAAVYGAAGPVAATAAFSVHGAEDVAEALVAFLRSGEGSAVVDVASARLTLARVGEGLVLAAEEPLPLAEPAASAEPEDVPAERSFFSVKRRKLSTDRGRMSMNGLLQRWHTRQAGSDLPSGNDEAFGDDSPAVSDAAAIEPSGEPGIPDSTAPDAAPQPSEAPVAPSQPRDRESQEFLPDIDPDEAGRHDVPLSVDEESPAVETLLRSGGAASGLDASERPGADTPAAADTLPAVSSADAGAPEPAFVPRFDMAPVRFVWQIDRDGKFRSLTPEFSAAVGPRAADVAGRSFREVANVFGFDQGGEIARLLDRRDTWSGRSVLWPVQGSDRKVPIDLAALPTYARDRSFDGFRGFGIVRMNEAVADPEAIGMILGDRAPESAALPVPDALETRAEEKGPEVASLDAEATASEDAPKVIRLEERRRPREGALSQAEEAAFRAIGMKLGKPDGAAAPRAEMPAAAKSAPGHAPEPAAPDNDAPTGSSLPAPAEDQAVEEQGDGRLPGADLNPVDDGADGQLDAESRPTLAGEAEAAAVTVAAPPAAPMASSPWAKHDGAPSSGAEDLLSPAVGDAPLADLADIPRPAAEAVASPAPEDLDDDGQDEADSADPAALAAELEAVFASLPLPVLAEAHGALLYANREFQDLTGYESIAALEAGGGLESLFADRTDPLQTGELAIRRSNGQVVDVRVHLQRATFSGMSCLLMSFTPSPRDAVGMVPFAAEDSISPETADLRQQIEELQAVLDTATDGVVLLDPAGAIRAMNGSAHALFGIAQDDHTGRHLSSLFAHESQKATVDYLDMLRDDGLAGILNDGREVIGRVAQGGFIPLFITIGRLSGDRGWCVVIRDIAHWKRIEEDLVNARRQAEAASLHKSRFLANISHELRTPLNAIIGFADVMASECFGPIGNERYLEYLGDIKRSGHHVLDLVNDLLDISKIEAGKLDLAFEAVSLNEVVSEVVSLMQPQANRERVIVRSNLPSSVPPVVADRRTMRQIALNLVANAIRFTPAGGQIIASTTYTAEGDVLLRFRDSGIGMTEREIEIALTPFQQVHAPSANRGEGTGLGLPLTKAMVEANRAQFAISSTPNEGTLVEISFPSQRVLAD